MKKTILTILASALLAGSMIQVASASEHYRTSRVVRAAPVVVNPSADVRNAYAWSNPDYGYWVSRAEGGAISAPAGR